MPSLQALASILERPQSKVHSTPYEPHNQPCNAHRERAPTSPPTRRQHPRTRNRLPPTPTQTHRQHLRPKDGLRRCQQSLSHLHRLDTSRRSEASAHRARQRRYGDARQKGGKPSRRALALAAWVVLITNVPEAVLSARAAWVLARVRWQVWFRVWKRCFRVDECRRRMYGVCCVSYMRS